MNKKILFLLLTVATSFKVSASSPKKLELTFLKNFFFNHFTDRLTAVEYLPATHMFLLTFGQRKIQVSVLSLPDDRTEKLHNFCKKLSNPAIYANIKEFKNKITPKMDLATTFQLSTDIEDALSKQTCVLL